MPLTHSVLKISMFLNTFRLISEKKKKKSETFGTNENFNEDQVQK